MDAEVLGRYARIDARLDRITAIHKTQAQLIALLGLQIGRLDHPISGPGPQVGDRDRQLSHLALKVHALGDSQARLDKAMRKLADAQKATKQALKAFLKSRLRRHGRG